MADDYQFEDVDSTSEPQSQDVDSNIAPQSSGGSYADEIYSKQIKAKFRTFYIDLKESQNGKFIKISEKSHGRKSTIMMDAEDIPQFIEALQEIQGQL